MLVRKVWSWIQIVISWLYALRSIELCVNWFRPPKWNAQDVSRGFAISDPLNAWTKITLRLISNIKNGRPVFRGTKVGITWIPAFATLHNESSRSYNVWLISYLHLRAHLVILANLKYYGRILNQMRSDLLMFQFWLISKHFVLTK